MMNARTLKRGLTPILFAIGVLGMVVGALDPLEGAIIILVGSGLLAAATWLSNRDKSVAVYRTWLFGMIALGVLAMFVISHLGGVGGKSGRSMWWLLAMLPYPIGWLLGIANLIARGIEHLRRRHAA